MEISSKDRFCCYERERKIDEWCGPHTVADEDRSYSAGGVGSGAEQELLAIPMPDSVDWWLC